MSYVLLCKGNKALKPYYIEDIRKKIYTLEELCYYLYHNTVLCAEELVRFQLAHWIGHQLGFQDLSESLLRILEKEKRPEKIASQIFAYADYLTKQEREAVCEKIRRNSELSWNERKKMRADYYVLEKHYQDAIREYEDILLQRNTIRQRKGIILFMTSAAAMHICFILIWHMTVLSGPMIWRSLKKRICGLRCFAKGCFYPTGNMRIFLQIMRNL